jgi:hypothetical protein
MFSFAQVSGPVFFNRKLKLTFNSVSILLSRLIESYILFSSLVMFTSVTVPHTYGQTQMPLFSSVHYFWSPLLQSSIPLNSLRCRCFFQFPTSGHPFYNPPYLWTVLDAVLVFWSPLLQSSIPVNSLRYRILPARLRLHFYLLHTWVGRRTIETKPKATRTETWGRPLGWRWWRGVRAAVLINYSRIIAAMSLFWQSPLQTVTNVSVPLKCDRRGGKKRSALYVIALAVLKLKTSCK